MNEEQKEKFAVDMTTDVQNIMEKYKEINMVTLLSGMITSFSFILYATLKDEKDGDTVTEQCRIDAKQKSHQLKQELMRELNE